jgi:hypothetical protein
VRDPWTRVGPARSGLTGTFFRPCSAAYIGWIVVSIRAAKRFVDDPVATLRKLGQPEMQKRFNYPMKDKGNNPPRKDD